MKTKTSNLMRHALDWAVAKAEGVPVEADGFVWEVGRAVYAYSIDWSLAGPIIEREKLNLAYLGGTRLSRWAAEDGQKAMAYGPTPLVAAMRCYTASKLGDEVEIPEELCQQQSS